MSIVNQSGLKKYVRDQGNNRKISSEFVEKLEAKIRTMIDRAMEWPGNKKVMRDFA